MHNKEKVAFFDFCETLVNFQTADEFVNYVRMKTNSRKMKLLDFIRYCLISTKVFAVVQMFSNNKYPIYKQSKLLQLRGMSYDILDKYALEYYKDKIIPNLIPEMIEILKKKQKDGYTIIIVSGGFGIYLRYFVEDFNLDRDFSTNIKFKDGVCCGCIDGIDCMNERKVELLNTHFDQKSIVSEAYSDSISDIPLLKWVDKAYVVSCNVSQCWHKSYFFNEIVWKR